MIEFKDYKEAWLLEKGLNKKIHDNEKESIFARNLLCDYLDYPNDFDSFDDTEGEKDHGVTLSYYSGEEEYEDEEDNAGNIWYLVKSKYESESNSLEILKREWEKVKKSYQNPDKKDDIFSQIYSFINDGQIDIDKDKVIYLFMTLDPIIEHEDYQKYIQEIDRDGKELFGDVFEFHAVSLFDIYERDDFKGKKKLKKAKLTISNPIKNPDCLIGLVSLMDLYNFLYDYKYKSNNNLDDIYDRNVRKFLGLRGKINKSIQKTLTNDAEITKFHLYNNGITIIVDDYEQVHKGFELTNPYIVNGCQTTRTIWEVMTQKDVLNNDQWKKYFEKGSLMVKIPKISNDESLLENITRYTNSQNAVKDKDFMSLIDKLKKWKQDLEENKYSLFLEIQTGSWLSLNDEKQKSYREGKIDIVNILKVYASGWLNELGSAFGSVKLFTPTGRIYKEITNSSSFNKDAIFVCYLLIQYSKEYQQDLKSFKYTFFKVFIDFVRHFLKEVGIKDIQDYHIVQSILKLKHQNFYEIPGSISFLDKIAEHAKEATSNYAKEGFQEDNQGQNENAFLKNSRYGKDEKYAPMLSSQIKIEIGVMRSITQQIISLLKEIKFINVIPLSESEKHLPNDYVNSILELAEKFQDEISNNMNITWEMICNKLNISVPSGQPRLRLAKYVAEERPDWDPVPPPSRKKNHDSPYQNIAIKDNEGTWLTLNDGNEIGKPNQFYKKYFEKDRGESNKVIFKKFTSKNHKIFGVESDGTRIELSEWLMVQKQ